MTVQASFSVIVPTFNRARFLPEALESILMQGIPDVQVIVVDDGSTDNTEAVIAAYGSSVQYVRQENRGSGAARNAGVSLATGRFISFLDSDDVWKPGKMKAERAVFEDNPTAEVVICDCERWVESEMVCPSWFVDRGLVIASHKPFALAPAPPLWVKGKIFATCCLSIKRATIERLGLPPFDTSLETHEDWDFAIRMHHSCNIMVLPMNLAKVRRFNDGSRIGRPLPGTPYPPPVLSLMAYRRYRIFEKAQRLKGWPDDVVARIENARGEAAREFAENLGGPGRRNLARVVVGELRRNAFANAASVAATGLLPSRAKSFLKSTATDAGQPQVAATTDRRS